MIKVCENKEHNIIISNEEHNSLIEKTPNENFPYLQKNIFPSPNIISLSENPIKTEETNSLKNNSTIPSIETTQKNENIWSNKININLSGKNKEKNNFTEKKRKRKPKLSYSNSNKKSKNKITLPPLINLSNKVLSTNTILSPSKEKNISLNEYNISNGAIKFDPSVTQEQKHNEKTSKKKQKISEKERIALAEKEFMEKLNKEYPDEQYQKDLENNLKEEKAQFMQKNFPIMYRKDKFYLYTILLNKRRTQSIHFINPNTLNDSLKESKKLQTLYLNEEPEISEQNQFKIYDNSNNNKYYYYQNGFGYDPKKIILDFRKEDEQSEIINNGSFENNNNKNDKNIDEKNKEEIKNKEGLSDASSSEYIIIKNLLNTHYFTNISNNLVNGFNNISGLKFKKIYNDLPKQVWSKPDDEKNLDIELFYYECKDIWPHDECKFVKEIALEFLMKNNYSMDNCLNRINDFVTFMKKRANELDITILSEKEKNVKNYCLRKTKYN